eukprot:TRINITY_DN3666_c0_g1_i4.p1 TRINITY_DN3666_c0_g1~~TRINITY_DN3666_c0_g1_i4.p1  ORF type:complete len:472 (+),score=88.48 TRINITY_DN3666_c0_g1_i4:52-1467(+)
MEGPSPVLMIRNVEPGLTAADLVAWASSFWYDGPEGGRSRTVCLRAHVFARRDGQRLGFVQMASVDEATRIMASYRELPDSVCLRSRPVNLAYSRSQVIRAAAGRQTDDTSQAAPTPAPPPSDRKPILLVVLKGLRSLVCCDEVFWLLSQFGPVDKVSYFFKDDPLVLAQFSCAQDAGVAMHFLNGKKAVLQRVAFAGEGSAPAPSFGVLGTNLHYPPLAVTPSSGVGSCHFAIVPSHLHELQFQNSDPRNIDYRRVNAQIWAFFRGFHPSTTAVAVQRQFGVLCGSPACRAWRPLQFLWRRWVRGDGWLSPRSLGGVQQVALPKPDLHVGQGLPPLSKPLDRLSLPPSEQGRVLRISGMVDPASSAPWPIPGCVTAATMWKLGTQYGSLVAAKLMYMHPGCCLLEFETATDCAVARGCLDGTRLFGRRWRAVRSVHGNALHWSGSHTAPDRGAGRMGTGPAPQVALADAG